MKRRAFNVLLKPIGPHCNLRCAYCFYLDTHHLYPEVKNFRMSDEVLEAFVRQYIAALDIPEVGFVWQGGEPTLLGLGFFEKVIDLQRKYAGGKRITNSIQTNGTLLDDAWCEFLATNRFLVGLSLDGPEDLHDTYRVDGRGEPTFGKVMRGAALLKKHRVDFNTLTVVNRTNSRHPLEVYRFLKEAGSGYLQFIPLVERIVSPEDRRQRTEDSDRPVPPPSIVRHLSSAFAPPSSVRRPPSSVLDPPSSELVTSASVEPERYGTFLIEIFDEWVRQDVGKVFVQLFDVDLGNWAGFGSSLCLFSETCGAALALEHNGDLYSCDHFVDREHRLGNIVTLGLQGLAGTAFQRQFGESKSASLPRACRLCEVRFACHGECPKNRFSCSADGEGGLNYLCPAYRRFFHHVDAPMRRMADLLRQRRSPAEIMETMKQGET